MKKNIRKFTPRQRARKRIRKKIVGTNERPRVSIFKSVKYTYAQVISDADQKTIIGLSTSVKDLPLTEVADDYKEKSDSTKGVKAANALGISLGKKIKELGIESVVFDRSGYVYHGRVKALADGIRLAGIKF